MKLNDPLTYRKLLKLYPRDHRVLFETEMALTFEAAAEDYRDGKWTSVLRFILREFQGLAREIVSEWNAKLAADLYRSANLARFGSVYADLIARLVLAGYESNSLFRNRCVPDLRMMRPPHIPRRSWYDAAGTGHILSQCREKNGSV